MRELPKSILVTGAAGNLGKAISAHLIEALKQGRIEKLRLNDIGEMEGEDVPGLERVVTSLSTREAAEALTDGIDAVVHLAGYSVEGEWDVLIPSNLVGPAYLYDSCVVNGVDRVLFASSNHAIGFYPSDQQINHEHPPKPDSRYGVTKAYGEYLAQLYAAKGNVRGYVMRIGTSFETIDAKRHLNTFQSHEDFCQFIEVGLSADYQFEIVYGLSDIEDGYWDNSNAKRLGYQPKHKPDGYLREPIDETDYPYQGGPFIGYLLKHEK